MTNENLEPAENEPILGDDPPQAKTLFGNKLYDRLKFLAQVVLPAIAVAYGSIAGGWGVPHTDKVVVTIMAVDLFLGVILGVSTKQYETSGAKYDGAAFVRTYVAEDGETPMAELGFGLNPDLDGRTIVKNKELVLKVIQE